MKRTTKQQVLVQNYPFGQIKQIEEKSKSKVQNSQNHILDNLENQQKDINKLQAQSQKNSYGINYNDPFALEKMIDSFFYKDQEQQTEKFDPKSKRFQDMQEQAIHQYFNLKVEDDIKNFDEDNIPKKDKFGHVTIKCPVHKKYTPKYFCIEPDCQAQHRVCCKECIVEGPHRLHKNEHIEYVEKQVQNLKRPIQKTFNKYKSVVKQVQEPFEQLKQLFINSMNLVMEHYLKELQPELKKLFNIKDFLEKVPDNFQIQQKYKNKPLENLIFQVVSEQREEYFKTITPDKEKLDLFLRFTEERTDKLKTYSKEYLKHLLPTFLQEINYNRLIQWEEDQQKLKEEEEKKYYEKYGVSMNEDTKRILGRQKDQLKHENHTDIKGQVSHVFQQHQKEITDLISLTQNLIVSCSEDQQIKIMDLEENKVIKSMNFQAGPVICLEQLSEKYIISYHQDQSIRIIDYMNALEVEKMKMKGEVIFCMSKFNDEYLLYGTDSGNVGKINYKKLEFDPYHINAHTCRVRCISKINEFSYCTGANDGVIKIWDFESNRQLKTLDGHSDAILNLLVMDQYSIVSNCYSKKIIHWNIKDYRLEQEYSGFDYSEIMDEFEAPDDIEIEWKMAKVNNDLIVSAGEDCNLKVWNFRTMKVLKYMQGHKGSIYSLAVSKNGNQIVSGDKYSQVIVWK